MAKLVSVKPWFLLQGFVNSGYGVNGIAHVSRKFSLDTTIREIDVRVCVFVSDVE